jgi:hypothetical protein
MIGRVERAFKKPLARAVIWVEPGYAQKLRHSSVAENSAIIRAAMMAHRVSWQLLPHTQ